MILWAPPPRRELGGWMLKRFYFLFLTCIFGGLISCNQNKSQDSAVTAALTSCRTSLNPRTLTLQNGANTQIDLSVSCSTDPFGGYTPISIDIGSLDNHLYTDPKQIIVYPGTRKT